MLVSGAEDNPPSDRDYRIDRREVRGPFFNGKPMTEKWMAEKL